MSFGEICRAGHLTSCRSILRGSSTRVLLALDPHQDVLIESSGNDHQRLVDQVDDPVLHRDVAPDNPGNDHSSRVRSVADDRVGPDHDRVLPVVVKDLGVVVAEAAAGRKLKHTNFCSNE